MGVPLCNSIMRNILYFGVVIAFFAAYLQCKPSNLEDIDEEEFEDKFHLPPVNDPVEFKKREEALKENEAEIKEVNKKYKDGESTWFDKVNKYSDLPEDEFIKERTGAAGIETGRGLIAPPEEEELMRNLRGTLISTATAEHLFLPLTALLIKVWFPPSRARDSVDLVLPLPPQTVLRPATGRSLESLETTLSSRWWTVDMAREGLDAMVLILMHMPSGLVIEERDLPVKSSTPTKTLTLALPAHQGFLSSTRELECLDPTTLMEVMRS